MDDLAINGVDGVELTPVVTPVTPPEASHIRRPRLWTAFAVPAAGLALAIAFQIVFILALIAWKAAHGVDVKTAVDNLMAELSTPGMFI